jgi:hypothetical protein
MQTEPLQPFCSCVITAHGGQKVLQQHPGGARPVILYVAWPLGCYLAVCYAQKVVALSSELRQNVHLGEPEARFSWQGLL